VAGEGLLGQKQVGGTGRGPPTLLKSTKGIQALVMPVTLAIERRGGCRVR
jgi:hypothetical protein